MTHDQLFYFFSYYILVVYQSIHFFGQEAKKGNIFLILPLFTLHVVIK